MGERPNPYAQPAWTISTLAAFYLVFPFILRRLQSLPSPYLSSLLVLLYHTQCLPYLLLIHAAQSGRMEDVAARHPLTRLPVFAMGVIAGLLQLRNVEDQNHDKTFLHDIFPWTFTQEQFSEKSQESR